MQKINQSAFKRGNRRKGKKLFENMPHYSCYEDGRRSCTTARNFIRKHNHKPPCIITVLKYTGQNARENASKIKLGAAMRLAKLNA